MTDGSRVRGCGEPAGGDWGCGILWGGAWKGRFAGFWVCMRLYGRLAGVFLAGVVARVGGLHAGRPRAVSRPGISGRRRFFFPPLVDLAGVRLSGL